MTVPLVEDYAAIAKRLAELDRRSATSFHLPAGISIYLPDRPQRMPRCRLCFILDDIKHRLYFASEASDEKLGSEEGMGFIHYLNEYFPSVLIISSFELRLSPEDSRVLSTYLRGQQ